MLAICDGRFRSACAGGTLPEPAVRRRQSLVLMLSQGAMPSNPLTFSRREFYRNAVISWDGKIREYWQKCICIRSNESNFAPVPCGSLIQGFGARLRSVLHVDGRPEVLPTEDSVGSQLLLDPQDLVELS